MTGTGKYGIFILPATGKERRRMAGKKKSGAFIICLNCGKKKELPPSKARRNKFCNPKCYKEYVNKALGKSGGKKQ